MNLPSVDESAESFTGREFYSLLISGFNDYERVNICTYSLGEVYEDGGLTNLYESLRRLQPRLLVGFRESDNETRIRAKALAKTNGFEVRHTPNVHIKLYHFTAGRRSRLFVGSMNLAHPYNREIMVETKGRTKSWLINEFNLLWAKARPLK